MESDEDDEDLRRPLLKAKRIKNSDIYRKTKAKEMNRRRNQFLNDSSPPAPIIHSGLKRLPFNGTLSELAERSEDESLTNASSLSVVVEQPSFIFSEPRFILSEEEEEKSQNNSHSKKKVKENESLK